MNDRDADVRALERRWLATGAHADGAAWLVARVRVGALAQEDLELASYLGHPIARRAVGQPLPFALPGVPGESRSEAAEGSRRGVEAWVRGLRPWGAPRLATAALAAAKVAAGGLSEVREALEALEAWLADPSAGRVRAVWSAAAVASARGGRRGRRDPRAQAVLSAAQVVDEGTAVLGAAEAAGFAVASCGGAAVVDAVRRAVSPVPFPP